MNLFFSTKPNFTLGLSLPGALEPLELLNLCAKSLFGEILPDATATAGVGESDNVGVMGSSASSDDDVESLHERIKTAERAMLVDAVGRIAREGITVDGRRVRIGTDGR